MYRICGIPRPLSILAPQNLVEGLSLLPKTYRILWNFILRFWTWKILNSLRFAQGFALSSAQLELVFLRKKRNSEARFARILVFSLSVAFSPVHTFLRWQPARTGFRPIWNTINDSAGERTLHSPHSTCYIYCERPFFLLVHQLAYFFALSTRPN